MDQLKEIVSSSCPCAGKFPPVAIVLIVALIILGVIIAVPLVIFLSPSAQAMSSGTRDLSSHSIRHPKVWPKTEKVQDDDLSAIQMTSLLPPNVSTCSGFGFACTGSIDMIIPSSKRCDGLKDCSDGSDEENCKECQSIYSCRAHIEEESEKKDKTSVLPTLICLTAEKLCNGVENCPDGSDEASCRSKCSKDQFKCSGSDACLPISVKCDGVSDCENESDESNCNKCQKGAHKCGKNCIKASKVCDGIPDCDDGSDEHQCDCKTCSGSEKALCEDGTCIMRSQVCDGKHDCLDGIDEENCPGSCSNERFSSKLKLLTCDDGNQYSEVEACSGLVEACELNCPKCDPKHTFTCPAVGGIHNKCIKRSKVCDGIFDCEDGADEKKCTPVKECVVESSIQFTCDNKCLESSRRCDGVWDCEDKSDEKGCDKCPSRSFKCSADKKCLPFHTRCNGVAECSDGSDEHKCSCQECLGTHHDTYMCSESNRCLKRGEVCSPYSMCPNATYIDKAYCASLALKNSGLRP